MNDRADVFVLAGDLFDRPQVEPGHLRQAQEVLQILYRAKIPVVAIEGNHDRTYVHSDDTTWVGFLAEDGLLQLLRPKFGPKGAVLTPWDRVNRQGAYVEHGGVRFVGAGYLGAATPAKVRQVLSALDGSKPSVLILHAGPDYFVGEGGGFSKEDLAAMREKVAYLALGHIHKPMVHDGWACNPGSPENCDLREAGYSQGKDGKDVNRGYAVVEIDPIDPNKPVSLQLRSNPRRPICRAALDCTPFGKKLKGGAAALVNAAAEVIEKLRPGSDAVIDLRLLGNLNLNHLALDQAGISSEICRASGVFAVSLDATQLNLADGADGSGSAASEGLSREEMERQAIRKITSEELLWGLAAEREAFATIFFALKEAVRSGKGPDVIAELIASDLLVEKIRSAKEAQTAPGEMTSEEAQVVAQAGSEAVK